MDQSELPEDIAELIENAEAGDPEAQFQCGQMYRMGSGVKQSYSGAVHWYRKAADQGYARGQNAMGQMYRHGHGVERNYAEAITWYQKAIDQGFAPAISNLGLVYLDGQGVEKNLTEALNLFNKAAELNYSDAQFNLGWMYKYGEGVAKSDHDAILWYSKAADQNHRYAQYNLALIYMYGHGCEKDYTRAQKLFCQAAMTSDPELRFRSIESQDEAERYCLSPKITDIRGIILNTLKVDTTVTPTMTHYTSLIAGQAMLLEKSPLRLGHINALNDPNEGKLLWRYLGHEPVEGKPAFVGCYLLDQDSLNMWRFYSKNHKNDDACGCAITFETDKFFDFNLLPELSIDAQKNEHDLKFSNTGKSPQESSAFYRIVYTNEHMDIFGDDKELLEDLFRILKNEVNAFIKKAPETEKLQQLSKLLGPLPYLLKDADYKTEEEHRIIITHLEYGAKEIQTLEPIIEDGIPKTSPRLYLELHRTNHLDPVKHVTLGPKSPYQEMMAPYWHHSLARDFGDQLKQKADFYIRTSKCAYK